MTAKTPKIERHPDLSALLILTSPRFGDHRGFFSETFRQSWLDPFGFDRNFVQDNLSYSKKKFILRGLHFQIGEHAQDKLIRCTRGTILDIAVDLRLGSPTFGRYVQIELSAENGRQLLVPIGFAHGYLTLEEECEVAYKCSAYFDFEADKGLAWNDPQLAIDWPLQGQSPILSEKDAALSKLATLEPYFRFTGTDYQVECLKRGAR